MITKIFNGNLFLKKYIIYLNKKSKNFNKKYNKYPQLAILIINNNFSTNLYIKNKINNFIKINIKTLIFKFSKNIKIKTIKIIINIINFDKYITAIILQLPFPKKLNKKNIINKIKKIKDIDMLTKANISSYITTYKSKFYTCTVNAIAIFINNLKINLNGKKITIFGFSNIVGKPLLFYFFSKGATVTSINKLDNKYNFIIKNTDILISAAGKYNLINNEYIPFGCIILDIGINKLNNNIILGDLNTHIFTTKSKYITPVPGGIGAITTLSLIKKIITLSYLQEIKNGRT